MCDEPEYIFYQTIDKKHCSTPKMEWTFNVSFYFVSMSYRHRDISIFGWAKSMSSTWISITRFILHIISFYFSWYVCWLYILSCLNCRLSVLKCLYKVELKSFAARIIMMQDFIYFGTCFYIVVVVVDSINRFSGVVCAQHWYSVQWLMRK